MKSHVQKDNWLIDLKFKIEPDLSSANFVKLQSVALHLAKNNYFTLVVII